MTTQNIESELSYAYLHAVAGQAGMSCKSGDRHDDGAGVDAVVTYRGPTTHSYKTQVQLDFQLKATVQSAGSDPLFLSYYFDGPKRYDKLRTENSDIYKLLLVLFLPKDPTAWLSCSPAELVLKNAAYWVCLYGAEPTTNSSGQTIYLPKSNLLTPEGLKNLVELAVHRKIPLYSKP